MKKKLLVLVALMLCMVTVLASCATSMKFEKVVGDAAYNDENPALTTSAKVDVVGTKIKELGDLVVFKGVNDDGKTVTTVYNLATGAVVYTSAVTAEEVSETEAKVTTTRISTYVQLYEYEGVYWFMAGTQKNVTTVKDGDTDSEWNASATLRNAKGEEFASISNTKGVDFATKLDLILVDSAMYRIAEDGTIAKAFDVKAGADFPAVDMKQGDYYYDMVDEEGDELDSVAIYNANLELIAFYEAPGYLSGVSYFVMNNGNVLVQGTEDLSEFAENYDFMVEGDEKMNLYTFVLNAEKGTVKELNLDYTIEGVQTQAAAENWLYNEKVENVAWIFEIEDERIDQTTSAVKLVSLDNNGKVKGVINGLIDNQAPELPVLVATNRWVVKDLAGNQYLLNEAGEVLGNVNGLDLADLNPNYIVLNGKIYDWDLTLKYNISANDASILQKTEHGVLMTADDELLLYVNGEVKTIIGEAAAEKSELVRIFVGNVATDEWEQIDHIEYSALRNSEDWKDEDLKTEWDSNNHQEIYFKRVYTPKYADIFFVAVKNDDNEITYKLYNDLGAEITSIHQDAAVFVGATAYVCTADSVNATLIRGTYTNPEDPTDIKTVYYRIG